MRTAGLSSGIRFPRVRVNESASPMPAVSTHASSAALARLFGGLTSAFGWLMCTLAAGAVAAFVAIVIGIRPCWIVLLLALPLTLALRLCGCIIPRWGGPVAALAALLAGFYAECLVAIARIAAVTGFPFGQALRAGGAGLMLQVAELGLDAVSILVYAGAAVIAAILAAWSASPRESHAGTHGSP